MKIDNAANYGIMFNVMVTITPNSQSTRSFGTKSRIIIFTD
jgi:hypothetical protein